jgi:hypothetical protein
MSLFNSPVFRAADANNDILAGAKWYFYLSNTSTPHNVYSDWNLATPHANPVVADSGGLFAPIYLSPDFTYRAVLKTAAGATIQDIDPVLGADRELRMDLSQVTGAEQIGAANGNTVQEELDKIGIDNLGVLSAVGDNPVLVYKTASGDPSGASDLRAWINKVELTGAYGATQINAWNSQTEIKHTAGTVTFVYGLQGYNRLGFEGSTTGAITTSRGIEWHTANESGNAQAVGSATNFYSGDVDLDSAGANGTIGTMTGFFAGNLGHASRITSAAYSFFAGNMTAGAPITAAFATEMTSGTGKWAFLGKASAPSALAGALRIGDNTVPTDMFEVNGKAKFLQKVQLTLTDYANDAAAATGGVAIGELYRTGSAVMVRVS